jgi:hypothetical protein
MAANDYHRAVAHAWTDLGTWPIVHPDGLQALWRYTKPGEPPAYINPNDAWGKDEAKKLLKAARDLKDGKLLPPKRGIRLNHSLLKGDPSRIIPAILREGLRADPGGEGAHSESPGSLFFVADKFHSPNAAVITVDIPDGWEGWQGAVGAWYDWKSKRLTERPSPGSTVALAYSVPPEFVVAINGLPVAEYKKRIKASAARVAARYRTAYKNVRELAKHADPAAIKFMADMEPYIFLRTSQTGNVLLETITRGVPPKGAAAQVEFSKGTVTLLRERWKMDPDTGIILRALQRIPEAKHLTVQAPRRNNLGTVDQLARKLRSVQITTPQEQDEDGGGYNMEDFTIEVLQELSDAKHIFHATRASHLPSIMKKGLVPSGTVDQGTGWTQYNFHLQNAVYLTLDYDYAVAIAKTLANRFGEEGVVLRVKGSAVSDYSKLVVDEDALENYVRGLGYNMGSIDPARPGFLQSVVDDIESFGYLGTIPPSALKVVRRVGSPSAARVAARYLARGV